MLTLSFTRLFTVLVFVLLTANTFGQTIKVLDSGQSASFRGISVASASEAWVSGSQGTVIRTTDSGATWTKIDVPDSAELDFRDIEVLPDGTLILMSIGNGSTSKLFRSDDHGATWTTVLQNHDEAAFFDGIAFHRDGKRGVLFGDPVNGLMDLYLTKDGGQTWVRLPDSQRPKMADGEFGFAASGTGVAWTDQGIEIATGGTVARIHQTKSEGKTWNTIQTPLLTGRPSAGIFSMAVQNNRIVIVGGDYLKPKEAGINVAISNDHGTTFQIPTDNQLQHKACVRMIGQSQLVACGRTGVDVSENAGQTWTHLSDDSYYTMDVDQASGVVFLAGPKGSVAILSQTSKSKSESESK